MWVWVWVCRAEFASRPHYARAWPQLLYAAALRYNACFRDLAANKTDNTVDNRSTKTENGNFEFFEPVDERFHLLFGICMEALCAQRDISDSNTVSVLLSLVTLLDAPENRARLFKDKALAIELCQIIHRIGLTQDNIEALLLAADILQLIILGGKEQLHASMQAKIKELSANEGSEGVSEAMLAAVATLGEGGPTGDVCGARCVSAGALRAAACLVVRRLPALGPRRGLTGVIGVPRGLGPHADALLVKCLAAMSQLTDLTSPQGAVSLLPTVLHVATEVLREGGAAAEAGVLLLQRAADCRAAAPDTSAHHARLLQTALAKLLHSVKTEASEQRIEPITGARGMAAVLGRAAPSPELHYPCINHFRQCLDTRDNDVFAACCGVLRGVWSGGAGGAGGGAGGAVSWWARALGARVVARAAAARRPADAAHARAAVAAVTALDDLVAAAPEPAQDPHKGIQLLRMLVPIVISYLREGNELASAPPHVRTLHEFALQWLMRVGPKYPQEFKTMMQQSPDLRTKLENAVKANQISRSNKQSQPQRPVFESRPAKPTIQLKTDFSDFR
ncbi:unnamed protein product [Parnassius mnemosyne]|uniref:HEAT repeat-containing protein 5B n=1 Tax=Parnassius mnemosyne TaxID=213953 RepID=A0AAV1LEP7_9NEOP